METIGTTVTTAASVAQAARAALDEHEAAAAAKQQEADQQRHDDAHAAIRTAIAQILGPVATAVIDPEIVELDTGQVGGFTASALAGDVALMVQRRAWNSPTDVQVIAACPDCQEDRAYGSYIRHLHELGAALRSSEQPCHQCQGRQLMVQPEPAWKIDRFADVNEAAHVAEEWEKAGYEIRLYHGEDSIVVAGHRYHRDDEAF